MVDSVSEGLPLFRLVETEIEQHLLPFSLHTYKKENLKSMEYLQIFNTSTLSSFCWCALSAVTSSRVEGDDFRYCPSIFVEAKLYFFCISTNNHQIKKKYYFMIFVHEAYRSVSVSIFGSYIIPISLYHVQT